MQTKIKIHKSADKEWHFGVYAANGEQIESSEGYKNLQDAIATAHNANPDSEIKVYNESLHDEGNSYIVDF